MNKLTNGLILHSWSGSAGQWKLLYTISAIVAFLPAIFFSLWGSADLQPWAIPKLRNSTGTGKKNPVEDKEDLTGTISSSEYPVQTLPVTV